MSLNPISSQSLTVLFIYLFIAAATPATPRSESPRHEPTSKDRPRVQRAGDSRVDKKDTSLEGTCSSFHPSHFEVNVFFACVYPRVGGSANSLLERRHRLTTPHRTSNGSRPWVQTRPGH